MITAPSLPLCFWIIGGLVYLNQSNCNSYKFIRFDKLVGISINALLFICKDFKVTNWLILYPSEWI